MSPRLAELTTQEAEESVRRGDVVVLPTGALEQHGPALPLGTDVIRAEAVCERLAEALPDQVVIAPALPLGVSPHHLAFAGTVSLRPATFCRVLREYIDCLAGHGWTRFLVVTGHGGNNAALGTLAHDLLHDRPDLEFAWTPITSVAADAVADLGVSEVHGHCGEAETAQMLYVAPALVRTDLLAPGTTRLDELDGLPRLARRPGHPTLAVRYDRLSADGVLGDPRRVTADDGRTIIDLATRRIADFVSAWLAA